MITYFYWIAVVAIAMAIVFFFGRANHWRFALFGALGIFVFAWAAYFFHFQQVFVKRYGGQMSITVPQGQFHMGATWKDENLWIENYDPLSNTCHFNEYSKGSLLQGKVSIKNCNPLLPVSSGIQTTLPKSSGK